jgi:predicted nucleic acid-binding protein
MRVLLDTNIFARLAQPTHPHHTIAKQAVTALRLRDDEPCVVPQVLYELWVVCTRPVPLNGLGMTSAAAGAELANVTRFAFLYRDERAILQHWQQLVANYEIKGKAAHDARVVAAMVRHGVKPLLTFNVNDFSRFREIDVLAPDQIANLVTGD